MHPGCSFVLAELETRFQAWTVCAAQVTTAIEVLPAAALRRSWCTVAVQWVTT